MSTYIPKEKILGLSLDADGCFFNEKYFQKKSTARFLDSLERKKACADNTIVENFINAVINKIKHEQQEIQKKRFLDKEEKERQADAINVESILIELAKQHSSNTNSTIENQNAAILELLKEINEERANFVLEANEVLLKKLAHKIKAEGYTKVILMVGSNRQSHKLDRYNSERNRTESFYPILEKIKKCLNALITKAENTGEIVSIDKALLGDLLSEKPDGYTFNYASKPKYCYPVISPPQYKFSILYTQIHRIAAAHSPEAEITYSFLDDRDYDILSSLKTTFEKDKGLIPANVNLQLHHYTGDYKKEPYYIQQGTGPIDYYYKANLKLLQDKFIDAMDNYALEFPENFKKERIIDEPDQLFASWWKKISYLPLQPRMRDTKKLDELVCKVPVVKHSNQFQLKHETIMQLHQETKVWLHNQDTAFFSRFSNRYKAVENLRQATEYWLYFNKTAVKSMPAGKQATQGSILEIINLLKEYLIGHQTNSSCIKDMQAILDNPEDKPDQYIALQKFQQIQSIAKEMLTDPIRFYSGKFKYSLFKSPYFGRQPWVEQLCIHLVNTTLLANDAATVTSSKTTNLAELKTFLESFKEKQPKTSNNTRPTSVTTPV